MRIGTDITVVSRIESSLDKFGDKFLNKFLTKEEQNISKRVESIAGYWAAKEAISKALGCGIGTELCSKTCLIRHGRFSDKGKR